MVNQCNSEIAGAAALRPAASRALGDSRLGATVIGLQDHRRHVLVLDDRLANQAIVKRSTIVILGSISQAPIIVLTYVMASDGYALGCLLVMGRMPRSAFMTVSTWTAISESGRDLADRPMEQAHLVQQVQEGVAGSDRLGLQVGLPHSLR